MTEYYRVLEVSKDSTLDDIKKAYKRLALIHHPDINKGDSKKFLKIQEAYQYLLKNHKPQQQKDTFSSMFRDMFHSMHKEPVKTHLIHLSVSILEAMNGIDKTLSIKFDIPCSECTFVTRDRCKICGGVGYIKEDKTGTFSFRDISNQNQTYVYKNYHKGITLQIKVSVSPNNEFYVRKDTIYTDVPLDIFRAILGGKTSIKTPKSDAIVEFSGGKIKDFSCCVKGVGLCGKDLVVNFKLFLPKDLTLNQKEMLNSIINYDAKKQS